MRAQTKPLLAFLIASSIAFVLIGVMVLTVIAELGEQL